MNAFLSHIDLMPIAYGFIIFIGLAAMWHKLIHGKWLALAIELTVFILVFKLHGGSMAGGFAASIAALLAGAIMPAMFRRRS